MMLNRKVIDMRMEEDSTILSLRNEVAMAALRMRTAIELGLISEEQFDEIDRVATEAVNELIKASTASGGPRPGARIPFGCDPCVGYADHVANAAYAWWKLCDQYEAEEAQERGPGCLASNGQ